MVKNKPHPHRKWKVLLLLSAAITSLTAAADVSVVTSSDCATPQRTVKIEDNSILVTYEFSEISQLTVNSDNEIRHYLPGFGYCNEVGMPMLPMRIDTFRIPSGFEASVSATATVGRNLSCEYVAVDEPLTDNATSVPDHLSLTPFEGTYPSETASLLSTYSLRGESVAEIVVCPVQYNYTDKTATIYEKIEYRITFIDAPMLTSLDVDSGSNDRTELSSSSYMDDILSQSMVSNINEVGDAMLSDTEGFSGSVGYLVVTTDKFLGPVETFLRWKKYLGYTTHVISRSQWNSGVEVCSQIRDFRKTHGNLRYLLVVGDDEDVPAIHSVHRQPHITDVYFGTMDDSSYIPDLYLGRISVKTENEANDVFNKLVRLEMCPIEDERFYKNAVHAAYYETDIKGAPNVTIRRFVETAEEIRDYVAQFGIAATRFYTATGKATPQFYSPAYGLGKEIPKELQSDSLIWKASPGHITSGINSGSLYALYRGHGTKKSWHNILFQTDHFNQLSNYELYPTVFSLTCNTGRFNNMDDNNKVDYADCFAEALLKIPFGGASSVIASTEESLSGYNDAFAEGIIDAIWPTPGLIPVFSNKNIGNVTSTPTPTYRLGQIMAQGLHRMNEQYGTVDKDKVKYEYELFHLFGDPSMYFFTEMPKPFSNVEITRMYDGILVNTHGEQASISFFNDRTDEASKFETTAVWFPTADPESTVVCLTGHNRLTYLDGVLIPIADDSALRPQILSYSVTDGAMANVKVFPGESAGNLELSVSDINGRHIHSVSLESDASISEINLLLSDMRGIYVITLRADGVLIDSKKIIK